MDLSYLKTNSGRECKMPENLPKDLEDAMLLMKDYGGKESETTGVLLYTYQFYTASIIDKDIAGVLKKISFTEMHHHMLLGTTITNLGGDPIIGADYKYWTAGYLNYSRKLKEMLMLDIEDEQQGIINYQKTIERLNNKDIAQMIECIIADEKVHVETLKELLKIVNEKNI